MPRASIAGPSLVSIVILSKNRIASLNDEWLCVKLVLLNLTPFQGGSRGGGGPGVKTPG
jgi:hypothetical protein